MTGQLPPLQQPSPTPLSQPDSNNSMPLPSLAHLFSSPPSTFDFEYPPATQPTGAPCDSVRQAPSDRPDSSSTSLAAFHHQRGASGAPSSSGPSWTAINRPTDNSSLAPPLTNGDRIGPATHDLYQHASSPSIASPSANIGKEQQSGRNSPPQHLNSDPLHAKRSASDRRQDSAVSESADHPRSMISQNPTISSNAQFSPFASSPESLPNPSPSRSAAGYPKTPPSPAPSPVLFSGLGASRPAPARAHSTGRRQWLSPSSSGQQRHLSKAESGANNRYGTSRERAYSDSRTTSSALSNASPSSPRRVRFDDHSAAGIMPPPRVTSHSANAQTVVTEPVLHSFTSISRPDVAVPNLRMNNPFEAMNRDVSQAASGSSAIAAASSYPMPDPPSDTTGTDTSPEQHPSPLRCSYCHEVWTCPLPDTSSMPGRPSATLQEFEDGMENIRKSLEHYQAQQASSYQDWLTRHRVKPRDPTIIPPCVAAQPDASKRKSDIPADDADMTSKFRKLTYDSPSPKAHLSTPPPDIPSIPPPQASSGSHAKYRYETSDGSSILVNEQLATIMRMCERPRYNSPPNDSTNMWFEPGQKDKSNTREGERHEKPKSESPHEGSEEPGAEQQPPRPSGEETKPQQPI
ncbi:hypothetical protein BU26DRAFT_153620 [Trematosphaeria pertusa]|uniref:Uncharacterized protein n=1 Tax=Trematosphaeria pertusa TaxID=390896 RepID=A0A6A6IXM7_9PLEO|nr:uncharacterized protein BU26DRAFT_153620 [Trematosphaeria pertusa]KAF2255305.1 hypothetical protein BU26DRAFT_153620 [Trematosphaeria pertusa]